MLTLLPLIQKPKHPDQRFLKVLAVAYIDTPGTWNVDALQAQLMSDLASATTWQGNTTNLNCNTWGCQSICNGDLDCSERRYLIWWMQHFPGIGNIDKDRNGVTQPNWWLYLWK